MIEPLFNQEEMLTVTGVCNTFHQGSSEVFTFGINQPTITIATIIEQEIACVKADLIATKRTQRRSKIKEALQAIEAFYGRF